MSEEIDALLFDAGGTLFDLRPSKEEVFYKLLTKRGFAVDYDRVLALSVKADRMFDTETANLDGVNDDAFWIKYDNYVLDSLGFTGDRDAFSRDLSTEFQKIIPNVSSWVEYPDAKPLLDDLVDREFRLGIISNATDLVRKVLDNLRFTKYFETIVVSAEVGVRKPDPRIFQIGVDSLKVMPNRAIYIGDRFAIDVQGASKAGLNAILLDRYGTYANANCLRVKSLSSLRRYL